MFYFLLLFKLTISNYILDNNGKLNLILSSISVVCFHMCKNVLLIAVKKIN